MEKTILIEPGSLVRSFFVSEPFDCERGSLNRKGMMGLRSTNDETLSIIHEFLNEIDELYSVEIQDQNVFNFSLVGEKWWTEALDQKVVHIIAKLKGWSVTDYSVAYIPVQRQGYIVSSDFRPR